MLFNDFDEILDDRELHGESTPKTSFGGGDALRTTLTDAVEIHVYHHDFFELFENLIFSHNF